MANATTIIINLTPQEAECLKMVFEGFMAEYYVNRKEVKPCMPFLKKLKGKIDSANVKWLGSPKR